MTNIFKLPQSAIMTFFISIFYLSSPPVIATPKNNQTSHKQTSSNTKQLKSTTIENPNIQPIDKEQQDCIDKNQTTAGMINCTNAAYKKWENEINKNYTELSNTLSPKGKEALKASQSAWIEYRNKELVLLKQLYEDLSGSMYRVMWAQDRLDIVKKRALELKEHTYL